MFAIQTFQIVEIGVVELRAQCSTSFTAGNATRQATKHGTSDAADSRSSRTKRHPDGSSYASSASGHGNAAGGTSNSTNRAPDLAAILKDGNAEGAAGRALNDHVTSKRWGQESHSFLASWR